MRKRRPSRSLRAAPTAQTDVTKHLVFFDWDKATLTPEARKVIATAAKEYKRTGTAKIVATGYTDLSGTPQYNLKLSERRACAPSRALHAKPRRSSAL